MVRVASDGRCYQDGGIEIDLHRPVASLIRSSRLTSTIASQLKPLGAWPWCTQTPFSCHRSLLLHWTQGDTFHMFFQDQLGAFAKLEAIANWLWEDNATGFVNLECHGIVNGNALCRDGHLKVAATAEGKLGGGRGGF